MTALMFLVIAGIGGAALANIIVKSTLGGDSSSTARFKGYLRQVEEEQLRRLEFGSHPEEERSSEDAPKQPRAGESSGLRSRLQGALESLDRPEPEAGTSDSVPEPKETTDPTTEDRTDR